MKKTNKKAVALGVGSLVGLGMLSGAVVDMNAFEVEKVGNGNFVIPKNPIQLDGDFYNSYLNSTDYTSLRNAITSNTQAIVVKSTQEYADVLANQISSNSAGFVVSEVLDLTKLGYTYDSSTRILTNSNGTTHNLGTSAGFNSIPKEILLTNYGFDKLLEMAGKKERALYFYSKYGMSTSYNATTNELTFRYTVVPHYIETVAETESRDLLVDSLVNMVGSETSLTTDKEKAYALYSYLTRFVTYSLESNTSSHSGSSLALDYEAVCQAIAYIYQAAGEKLGLNMKYMVGTAGGENHAWNAIEIDGQWYYTDATWGVYKNNGRASTAKEDNYILYSDYFLFSDKKNSDRLLTEASQSNLTDLGVSFNDTRFDAFTSYNNLGGGLFKDSLVVYKDSKTFIVDKTTAEIKKELATSIVNHQATKAAVVNNEYYQVLRNVSDNSLKIIVTNLETLETRELATIENSSMIGFVSNGMLIQDLNTSAYKVVLYSKEQQKLGTDKLFQIALDSSKLYYASDKALVDYGLSMDAISNRLSSFSNLVSIKDPVTGLSYETIDVDLEKDLEVKNFATKSEGSTFTVSVEFGELDKDSLTDETVDFLVKSDTVNADELYVIEFTDSQGQVIQKEVQGSVLLQGLNLSTLTGESTLLKDKESNSVYTKAFKVLTKDTSKTVAAYVSLVYAGEEIDKTTINVSSEILPTIIHTQEVNVSSEKITMVIANAPFEKEVTLKIGDETITTTVQALMDGLVIDTKGQSVISVSLDVEDFQVIVTPVEEEVVVPEQPTEPEEPQTPILTTKNIVVEAGKTIFTIDGLSNETVVKVITSTQTIDVTVIELNEGLEFVTIGEEIQIIVEGDVDFTVNATKVVEQPTEPVIPVEPTEPEPTEPVIPVEPTEPEPTEPVTPDTGGVDVPTEPTEPVEPTEPEPTEPEVPVTPVEPTEPENPVEEPTVPTVPHSTEKDVKVSSGDIVLMINGLDDNQNVTIVTSNETIQTTVGEVNDGKVFATIGGTIKVIVEGDIQFTVIATKVVEQPTTPTEPETPVTPVEPTEPEPTEPTNPVEPTEPETPVEPTQPEPEVPVTPVQPNVPEKPVTPTEPIETPQEVTPPVAPVTPPVGDNGNAGGSGSGGSSSSGEVAELPSTEGDGSGADVVEDSETLSLSVDDLKSVIEDMKSHYFEGAKVKNLSSLGTLRNISYSINELMEHVTHVEDKEVKAALIKDIEDTIITSLINELFSDDKLSPFNMKTNGNLRTHSNMVYIYLNRIINEVNPENQYLKELILEKQIKFIEESVWKNLKFK